MLTPTQLVDRWLRTREGTLALVKVIPPEHFDWRPRDHTFSCGDLVRHMMQAEEVFREVLVRGARGESWNPWELTGSGDERLRQARPAILQGAGVQDYGTSVETCLTKWAAVQSQTETALKALPADGLGQTIEHAGTAIQGQLWEMFLMMIEHEIHHRGQLSAYLKMLGAEQPALLAR